MSQCSHHSQDSVQAQPQLPLPQTHPRNGQDLLSTTAESLASHVGLSQSPTPSLARLLWTRHHIRHQPHVHQEVGYSSVRFTFRWPSLPGGGRSPVSSRCDTGHSSHRQPRSDPHGTRTQVQDTMVGTRSPGMGTYLRCSPVSERLCPGRLRDSGTSATTTATIASCQLHCATDRTSSRPPRTGHDL